MKVLIIILAITCYQMANANSQLESKKVLEVTCRGHHVDIYFTPAKEIIGHAQYTSTETTVGSPIEYRLAGVFFEPMGTIQTVIDNDSETKYELSGVLYSNDGSDEQKDLASKTQFGGIPVLRARMLAGNIPLALSAQEFNSQLGGLVAVTGGWIKRIGKLEATGKAGEYRAVEFDWNQVQWAYSCND